MEMVVVNAADNDIKFCPGAPFFASDLRTARRVVLDLSSAQVT
jgi:hypothetical protein